MGAHFQHPCFHVTAEELDAFLVSARIPLWAADAGGKPVSTMVRPERLALAVGNEGAGLTATTRSRAAELVSLPIASGVESLNVAVATGILLHELRP